MNREEQLACIKERCSTGRLRWTQHIMTRLIQRNISIKDVVYALSAGEIIEEYPTDYPYPSCLILGCSIAGHSLHIVCGIGPEELYLITAYYPDPAVWSADLKERKRD